MANRNYSYLDDILDGLGEAFDELNYGTSSVQKNTTGYSKVKKSTTNSKPVSESLPYVSAKAQGMSFDNRYDAFNSYVDNLVYGKYDTEKRDGFDTAIRHYKETLSQSRDFKHLESQIVSDIAECGKNLATDKYLTGYYQGLLVLKNIINQSKLACFRKFASKFN